MIMYPAELSIGNECSEFYAKSAFERVEEGVVRT
jgi:hypothetical protein